MQWQPCWSQRSWCFSWGCDLNNVWGSWSGSGGTRLNVRSDQSTAAASLHRKRAETPPGSVTLEISPSCPTWNNIWRGTSSTSPICLEFSCIVTLSTQCNILEPADHRTTPQRVYTPHSLCLLLSLSSSTYSVMSCLYWFMLTAKLLFPFPPCLHITKGQTCSVIIIYLTLTFFLFVQWRIHLVSHTDTSVMHIFTTPSHQVCSCIW